MRQIKLYFTGFWGSFKLEDNMFTNILRRKYDVVIDEKPDFLICSPLGRPYEYEKFDCPRIMYTGEFLSADFNAVDYFIGFDHIDFGDRAMRFPLFLYNEKGTPKELFIPSKDQAWDILKNKTMFCNFIFGHKTVLNVREEILQKISEYKEVACAGRYLNNMPDHKIYNICEKSNIMKQCKFSICAESVTYPGFTSEKIIDAYRCNSIPIYYGDPLINRDFDNTSFVNCMDYSSIEEAVKRIIEIDNDDEAYVDMLCKSPYIEQNYQQEMYQKLERFLFNIFDQSPEEAYRRPRYYRAGWHETYLKEYNRYMLSIPHRILRKLGI